MTLPKWLTTVTPFSKIVAIILFIILPILAFRLGMIYQQIYIPNSNNTDVNRPIENLNISTIKDSVIPLVNKYETKEAILKDLNENLPIGNYVDIPDTNLQIKIPKNYLYYEEELESNNIVGHVAFYVREDSAINSHPEIQRIPNIYFGSIKTSLTPKQWLSANVSYQGEKWNENIGTGKEIIVNDFSLFSVGVACCGGYNQMYIYPYQSLTGEKILVVIGTYDVYGDVDYNTENWTKGINSDRNIILDNIIATLKKK